MTTLRVPPDESAALGTPQYSEAYSTGTPPVDEAVLARIAVEMLGEQMFGQIPMASRSSIPTQESIPVGGSTPSPMPVTASDVDLASFAAPSVPSSSGPAGNATSSTANPPSVGGAPGASDHQAYYFLDESSAFSGAPSQPRPDHGADHGPQLVPDLGLQPSHYDVETLRRDFPILNERVHGKRLIWLDNAATTQKPRAVIDRISSFYEHENSNIHRGAHTLAARATDAYEAAREKTRRFLNASSVQEIIFVRGTTEAINLVAKAWGGQNIGAGDEIVLTWLEHHSNIVPWQQLAREKGAVIKVAPIDNDGQVVLHEYERLLSPRTRLVAMTQVSNALGTINPVAEMAAMAHRYGAKVLVDGAQSVSHMAVDVQALDADFFAFSGHKVFGPTGIGALYAKSGILEGMQPWQGGGNMITDVTFDRTVYAAPPARFEAGTGNIADAVGLGAALDYVMRIGMDNIAHHEHGLLVYGTEGLRTVPGLRLVGTAREKAGVLSFVLDGHRTEDVGAALDREGIAVRSGHHCAQPALRRFGLEASVRPSLALYNTRADLDALVDAVMRLARSGG